jgi:dTDP-4-amino-4,6-dideoxygalactose transaminase
MSLDTGGKISGATVRDRKIDIVEEFWDENILELCRQEARRTTTNDFLDELRVYLGASGRIWATQSGRIALRQFLASIASAEKRSVFVCSFNCRVVADAVITAGLHVETYDLDSITGWIDWEKVADLLRPRHAALVVPHLFGAPSDFRCVQMAAEKLRVAIIEDCAHTLGGKISSSTAGTLGDAAFFSFNYDKPISLGGGGALLVNNPILWPRIMLSEPEIDLKKEETEIKLFREYLGTRRLLKRNRSYFSPIIRWISSRKYIWFAQELFPVSGIGPLRASLGLWQLKHYPEIKSIRNRNASIFSNDLCKSWHLDQDVSAAWIKQKIIPVSPKEGDRISRALRHDGLPVGRFNWSVTLDRYLGLREKPNSTFVAKYSLDIPIHQNMTRADLEMIYTLVCLNRYQKKDSPRT